MAKNKKGTFGARVYLMDDDTVLIYQTRKRGTDQNAPYVIWPSPNQKGLWVNIGDDKSIAGAIREALRGGLT